MSPGRAERKKILFVEEVSGMGGSTVCLSNMISGLSGRGYDCVLAIYFRDPEIERRLFPGVKTYHLRKYFARFIDSFLADREGMRAATRAVKTLLWGIVFLAEASRRAAITYWIIKTNKVDIVHTNNSLGINMFSIYGAKLAGAPCVCHFRSFGNLRRIHGPSFSAATRVVTVSEAVKDALAGAPIALGSAGKFVNLYDGLSERELSFDYRGRRPLRDEYGLREGTKAVGMVGMLTEWKGFHVFLEAAKLVLEKTRDNVVFFVVGDTITEGDPYKAFLKARAEELGISDKVIFTGLRADTEGVYASLDIVVHASLAPEPFGRVIIEAMAASRPVVAADAGGPAEIIRDGETGLLYRMGDAGGLAGRISLLLGNDAMRGRIGGRARAFVEENMTQDATLDGMENIYRSVSGGVN